MGIKDALPLVNVLSLSFGENKVRVSEALEIAISLVIVIVIADTISLALSL